MEGTLLLFEHMYAKNTNNNGHSFLLTFLRELCSTTYSWKHSQ